MCRQYLTLYVFCQCEEDAGHHACADRKRSDCPGVSIETVYMQCFCNAHATKGFKTEKQSGRKKRGSLEGSGEKISFSLRRKWNQHMVALRSRTF